MNSSPGDAATLGRLLRTVAEATWRDHLAPRYAAARTPRDGVAVSWVGWQIVGQRTWAAHQEPATPRLQQATVVLTHPGGFWATTTVPGETIEVIEQYGEPREVIARWETWSPVERWRTVRAAAHDALVTRGGPAAFAETLARIARNELNRTGVEDPWAVAATPYWAALSVLLQDPCAGALADPEVTSVRTLAALGGLGNLADLAVVAEGTPVPAPRRRHGTP